MIVNILFYLFSIVLLLSSLMVILVNNSIYSVLFLVLSFIASASLLFLLKCEFLALMFIIIYVGAIAVLFLFVVMMLDIKTISLKKAVPLENRSSRHELLVHKEKYGNPAAQDPRVPKIEDTFNNDPNSKQASR